MSTAGKLDGPPSFMPSGQGRASLALERSLAGTHQALRTASVVGDTLKRDGSNLDEIQSVHESGLKNSLDTTSRTINELKNQAENYKKQLKLSWIILGSVSLFIIFRRMRVLFLLSLLLSKGDTNSATSSGYLCSYLRTVSPTLHSKFCANSATQGSIETFASLSSSSAAAASSSQFESVQNVDKSNPCADTKIWFLNKEMPTTYFQCGNSNDGDIRYCCIYDCFDQNIANCGNKQFCNCWTGGSIKTYVKLLVQDVTTTTANDNDRPNPNPNPSINDNNDDIQKLVMVDPANYETIRSKQEEHVLKRTKSGNEIEKNVKQVGKTKDERDRKLKYQEARSKTPTQKQQKATKIDRTSAKGATTRNEEAFVDISGTTTTKLDDSMDDHNKNTDTDEGEKEELASSSYTSARPRRGVPLDESLYVDSDDNIDSRGEGSEIKKMKNEDDVHGDEL